MGLEAPRKTLFTKPMLVKYGLASAGVILFILWVYFYNGTKETKLQTIYAIKDKDAMIVESEVLNENAPRVLYWENFLTTEECDFIVAQIIKKLERSAVATPDKVEKDKGLSKVDSVRTSSGAWIGRYSDEPAVQKFTRRVSMWSGVPRNHGEDIQFLEYKPGQYYKPHFDFFF